MIMHMAIANYTYGLTSHDVMLARLYSYQILDRYNYMTSYAMTWVLSS